MTFLSGVYLRHQFAVLTIAAVAVGAYLTAYLIRFDFSPDSIPWDTWFASLLMVRTTMVRGVSAR